MSLNQRIIVSASIVLLIFITLTAAALNSAYVESSENALKERLTSQLYALMAAAEIDEDGITLPTTQLDSLLGLPSSGLYAMVTDNKGNLMWQSSSVLDAFPPNPLVLNSGEKRFFTVSKDSINYWIHAYGVNWAVDLNNSLQSSSEDSIQTIELTFNIITDLNAHQTQLRQYRQTLWRWLLGMALLLLITQAVILRWGLSPLRKVSNELNQIEQGSKEHIDNDYPAEIKRLTDNINQLLKQEREQKTRYRNALGDLAHSLKTPLAVLQGIINKPTDSNDTAKTYIAQTDNAQEQLDRMNSIVEYQLQRAATAGKDNTGQTLPLKKLIERINDSLQKVYRDKNINIDIAISPDVTLKADEGDMMELFGNLLDNAYKWAQKSISISYQQPDGRHNILIKDDGPGITSDQADQLLKRGIRADETIAGHGIGLSIVKNIIDAYNGEIKIMSAGDKNTDANNISTTSTGTVISLFF